MHQKTEKPLSLLQKFTVSIAISPPGRWIVMHIVSRIDVWLSHKTQGMVSITKLLGFPLLILTTKGARSGIPRETPLLYFSQNSHIAVIASSLGSRNHPQWYFNLQAYPEASLFINGRQVRYTVRELEGTERQYYWDCMQSIYPGYDRYAQLASGRRIPVLLFTPMSEAKLETSFPNNKQQDADCEWED